MAAWVPIAAAVAGAAANKMMNSGGGGATSSVANEPPEYVRQMHKNVRDWAEDMAGREYVRFPGQRIAPWGPGSQFAYDATMGGMGGWMPYLNQASQLAGRTTQYMDPRTFTGDRIDVMGEGVDPGQVIDMTWSPENAEYYMSPYVQEALQPAVRDAQRAFTEDILGTRRGAAAEGAFGGARQALMEQESRRRHDTGLSDMLARGYADAYESAGRMFQGDAARRLQADTLRTGLQRDNLRDLYMQEADNRSAAEREFSLNEDARWRAVQGMLDSGRFMADLGNLSSTLHGMDLERAWFAGDREQAMRQLQLDQEYRDWVEARDWDERGFDYLLRALSATPGGYGTQTTRGPGTNDAAAWMGAGTALGGTLWDMWQNRAPPSQGANWQQLHRDPYPGTSGR